MAGYSDAEWYCVLKQRLGEKTGLGQVLDAKHGERLLDVLKRRQHVGNFLFAVPKCLWPSRTSYGLPGLAEGQIDWLLGSQGISIEGYERDMITDDLAREAELFPFISQLNKMEVILIGNHHLEEMKEHLRSIRYFVGIDSPNLHLQPDGIEDAVARVKNYGKPGVHLVSAGVSAAVIIDLLHDAIPNSWFIDCGSIWDAFVGIGEQRDWRAFLYAHPREWDKWKKWNIHGKPKD